MVTKTPLSSHIPRTGEQSYFIGTCRSASVGNLAQVHLEFS